MIKKKLAIITARGGSKRIPRKNIKPFNGFPIIKYSIEAALSSNEFDEVMVSTDDQEISEIAQKYGATVPFFRSAKNSDDHSGTAEVIEEVILDYKNKNKIFDYVCCIYPTAPFVSSLIIKEAMNKLVSLDADCVLPVVRYSYPIQRSLKIENGFGKMIWPENYFARSQDLSPTFHDSGQFYCLKVESLLEQKKLFAEKTIPIEISELEMQDIDNEVDWTLAELKYKLIHKKKN
ncbi:pseudaminic acid cytidylyltransferase [Akkermansiaceae bacterium]|nr:pseudaminic acid cytidylyltransferase [Akkermansiaceae bacterium]